MSLWHRSDNFDQPNCIVNLINLCFAEILLVLLQNIMRKIQLKITQKHLLVKQKIRHDPFLIIRQGILTPPQQPLSVGKELGVMVLIFAVLIGTFSQIFFLKTKSYKNIRTLWVPVVKFDRLI